MTSTNSATAQDYPAHLCVTKPWVTNLILPRLLALAPTGDWLDAGCGSGSIADACAAGGASVAGCDLLHVPTLRGSEPPWSWYQCDFLTENRLRAVPWSCIITNPSFTLADKPPTSRYIAAYDGPMRFISRALELAPVVACLHRCSWWHEPQEERKRFRAWLRANFRTEQVTIGRHNFYPHGSGDSSTYVWTIVSPGPGGPTQQYEMPHEQR